MLVVSSIRRLSSPDIFRGLFQEQTPGQPRPKLTPLLVRGPRKHPRHINLQLINRFIQSVAQHATSTLIYESSGRPYISTDFVPERCCPNGQFEDQRRLIMYTWHFVIPLHLTIVSVSSLDPSLLCVSIVGEVDHLKIIKDGKPPLADVLHISPSSELTKSLSALGRDQVLDKDHLLRMTSDNVSSLENHSSITYPCDRTGGVQRQGKGRDNGYCKEDAMDCCKGD